jgi:hypothetical protein
MTGESRMGHFTQGVMGPTEPDSLKQRAERFNSRNPRKFTANGVNQPVMLSADNGNSQKDAARQTPSGQLPSDNGYAKSTYDKIVPSYGMALNL